MAGNRVDFIFNLLDKVSGPAGAAERAMEKVGRAAASAKAALQSVADTAVSAGSRVASSFGKMMGSFKTWIVGGAALALLGAGVRKILKSAGDDERDLLAMSTMMGSRETADRVLSMHDRLASVNGVSLDANDDIVKNFALAGFGEKEMPYLLTAATDINAVRGEGGMNAFAEMMRTIKQGEPEGMSRVMNMLRATGIGEDILTKNLKKAYPDIKNFRKAIGEGLVDKNSLMTAILKSVQDIQGGALGKLSVDAGSTLPGLLEGIETQFERQRSAMSETKGFELLKGFLGNVRNVLDPDSPAGQQMVAAMAKMSNGIGEALFSGLQGKDGQDRILKFFDGVTAAAVASAQAIAGVGRAIGHINDLMDRISGHDSTAATGARALTAAEQAQIAGQNLIPDPDHPGFFKNTLSSTGPSMPDTGVRDLTPAESKALSGMTLTPDPDHPGFFKNSPVIPPPSASQAGSAGSAKASIHLENHVHLNGEGKTAEDADMVSRHLAEQLPTQLGSAFEQLGIETGAM